jgi:hypothetical protein
MKHEMKPFGAWHPSWAQPALFNYDSAEEARARLTKTYGADSGHVVVEIRVVPVRVEYVVEAPEPWKEDA